VHHEADEVAAAGAGARAGWCVLLAQSQQQLPQQGPASQPQVQQHFGSSQQQASAWALGATVIMSTPKGDLRKIHSGAPVRSRDPTPAGEFGRM